MPPSNLLKKYGLARNPFTDRTAENTDMSPLSLYEHSDLQHFKPTNETYIFFGRRGSGKTTIRMKMQREYERANEELRMMGAPEHFIIDLCRPGHMTACLKDFQARLVRMYLRANLYSLFKAPLEGIRMLRRCSPET